MNRAYIASIRTGEVVLDDGVGLPIRRGGDPGDPLRLSGPPAGKRHHAVLTRSSWKKSTFRVSLEAVCAP